MKANGLPIAFFQLNDFVSAYRPWDPYKPIPGENLLLGYLLGLVLDSHCEVWGTSSYFYLKVGDLSSDWSSWEFVKIFLIDFLNCLSLLFTLSIDLNKF